MSPKSAAWLSVPALPAPHVHTPLAAATTLGLSHPHPQHSHRARAHGAQAAATLYYSTYLGRVLQLGYWRKHVGLKWAAEEGLAQWRWCRRRRRLHRWRRWRRSGGQLRWWRWRACSCRQQRRTGLHCAACRARCKKRRRLCGRQAGRRVSYACMDTRGTIHATQGASARPHLWWAAVAVLWFPAAPGWWR